MTNKLLNEVFKELRHRKLNEAPKPQEVGDGWDMDALRRAAEGGTSTPRTPSQVVGDARTKAEELPDNDFIGNKTLDSIIKVLGDFFRREKEDLSIPFTDWAAIAKRGFGDKESEFGKTDFGKAAKASYAEAKKRKGNYKRPSHVTTKPPSWY